MMYKDAKRAMEMETARANKNFEELRETTRDCDAKILRLLKGE
jgi:hypothetical protein